MSEFVVWQEANSEFAPAVRLAAPKQVVKVYREMGAVEAADPNMHDPMRDPASIVPGTGDRVSELAQGGGAKWNWVLPCR
jgi:hypothetical protein